MATSLSRVCQRLQQVSIATSAKYGHTASTSRICSDITKTGLLPQFQQKPKINGPIRSGVASHSKLKIQTSVLGTVNLIGSELDLEYICPSLRGKVEPIILDIQKDITTNYDCPNISTIMDFTLPTSISQEISDPKRPEQKGDGETPVIQARRIMKIRHEKMKKHQRKKWMKKYHFMKKNQVKLRNRKKEKVLKEKLKSYAVWAEEFDAMEYVQERLTHARRGGYKVDIFKS